MFFYTILIMNDEGVIVERHGFNGKDNACAFLAAKAYMIMSGWSITMESL